MELKCALNFIGPLDNASGQICQMKDDKPVDILFELACPNCSEVASKNADEIGDALVTIVNAAPLLIAACQAELDFYDWHMSAVPSQVLDELIDRRQRLHEQIRAALSYGTSSRLR